jgi:hypothetical protein
MLGKTLNIKSQGIVYDGSSGDMRGKRDGYYEANSRFSHKSASNNGDTIRLQRSQGLNSEVCQNLGVSELFGGRGVYR